MLKNLSLRNKILFAITGLVVLSGLITMIFVETVLYDKLLEKLEKRGLVIVKQLASSSINPILTEKYFELKMIAQDFMKSEEDIEYIFILNRNGHVVMHTFDKGFPAGLREISNKVSSRKYDIQDIMTEKGALVDIAVPLQEGEAGVVHVGFSKRYISGEINSIIMMVLWFIGGLAVVGIGIAFVLSGLIVKPVAELAKAVKAVGSGDMDQRVDVHSNDEIGQLGKAFNVMLKTRKESEAALMESQRSYQTLTENLTGLVYRVFVRENNRVHFFNRVAENITGYTAPELAAGDFSSIESLIIPEDRGYATALVRKALDENHPFEIEYRIRHRDGHIIYCLELGTPICGDDGTPLYIDGVIFDITARKMAEEQLHESDKLLRDVTSNLGIGVYVLNNNGRIMLMNPRAEELWGWSIEELNEHGAHSLVHNRRPDGSPLPVEECRMHAVMTRKTAYISSDEVFVRKDGVVFPVAVICTPLLKGEDIVGSVTAFRDITEEKKMEEEIRKVQKLESLGILAGGIAHDFNNLLTGIMGNIQLAKMFLEANQTEKILPVLDSADEAAEAAKELSFRLLTFSKGGEPVRAPASIEVVVKKSVSLALGGSNIVSTVVIAPDLYPVEIDAGQMLQVFNNILINAKAAMPLGGVVTITGENVTISDDALAPLKGGRYVRVSIHDTGCGISQKILHRIFDPYFSTKGLGSQKGTGLGLSICMSVIKKHDGHIRVESREGVGTTFYIWLQALSQAEEIRRGGSVKHQPGVKKVLFMDDDIRIRRLVENMMDYLGYAVLFAVDGKEAIEIYRQAKESGTTFGAVILDLTIQGGMGGEETVKKLLEMDPGVKAVISSGYADSPVIKNYRAYGFVGAIEKPYKIMQLKQLLETLFAGREK